MGGREANTIDGPCERSEVLGIRCVKAKPDFFSRAYGFSSCIFQLYEGTSKSSRKTDLMNLFWCKAFKNPCI